ncbi:hypothetical protein D3C75_1188370 [compost metagenome]
MSLMVDHVTAVLAAATTQASAVVLAAELVAAAIVALPLVALAIPDMVNAVVILKEIVCPASAPTWKDPL